MASIREVLFVFYLCSAFLLGVTPSASTYASSEYFEEKEFSKEETTELIALKTVLLQRKLTTEFDRESGKPVPWNGEPLWQPEGPFDEPAADQSDEHARYLLNVMQQDLALLEREASWYEPVSSHNSAPLTRKPPAVESSFISSPSLGGASEQTTRQWLLEEKFPRAYEGIAQSHAAQNTHVARAFAARQQQLPAREGNKSTNVVPDSSQKPQSSIFGIALIVLACVLLPSYIGFDIFLKKPHPESPYDTVADGNIFWETSRESEALKNQHDLNLQIQALANEEFNQILDKVSWEFIAELPARTKLEISEKQPRNDETRRTIILQVLLQDALEKKAAGNSVLVFDFIADMLSGGTCRQFMGVLMPDSGKEFTPWLRIRIMALLVVVLMFGAPICVFYQRWYSKDNHITHGSNFDTWAEFTCISTENSSTTFLGVILLIVFCEYGRAVSKHEQRITRKMRFLPCDNLWRRIGELTNAMCLLMTMFLLPFIFWSEEDPQSIIFDAMAVLFIFQIDDLDTETTFFMEIGQDNYKERYQNFVHALEQCPISLGDIINFQARNASEIWDIRIKDINAEKISFLSAHGNKEVKTRLQKIGQKEDYPEYLVYHPVCADYHQVLGQYNRFGSTTMKVMWHMVYYTLMTGTVLLPLTYLLLGEPCYS